MYRGACLCGAVQFTVEPPYRWFAYCHCSMCRKHHGSLFGAGVGVERDRFSWLAGTSEIAHYRATTAFERPFCERCGSKVPGESHLPDVLLAPAGAIDGDFGAKPRAHIFVGSKARVYAITDSLPQFDAYPPSVGLPSVERPSAPTRPGIVTGSCLCGHVAYEIHGELERMLNCHCSRCRRRSGAPHATTAFAPPNSLRWTRGADAVANYALPEAPRHRTTFCRLCGSMLPSELAGVVVSLPVGSIDTPIALAPSAHIFVDSKAPWETITDTLPRHAALPD
jgi:hypothetical protein